MLGCRVREEGRPRWARQLHAQGIRGRQRLGQEPALRDHRATDEMHLLLHGAARRAVGIETAAPAARRRDDGREEQGLIEREVVRVAIEIEPRGLVGAMDPGTPLDDVQVDLEQALLRDTGEVLEDPGQYDLLSLAGERARMARVEIAREL